MTTSKSPLRLLRQQADKIARELKRYERGEKIDIRFAEKLEAARDKPSFKVGVVMDDKIVTIDMPWTTMRETSEGGLAEYILNLMCDTRQAAH